MKKTILKDVLLICLALLAATPGAAHAYMDPGSGSFILQMIIAGLLGVGVTLRIYWQRLRGLFGSGRKREKSDFDD